MTILKRIKDRLLWEYKLHIAKDKFTIAAHKWVADKGDDNLRVDYPLSSTSIVFDVGGFHGDWANIINKKYGSNIYIFEPVSSFHQQLKARFANIDNIKTYNFGLSNIDKTMAISVQEDGSSTIRNGGTNKENIQLKDITAFCIANNINNIDLIKINIEGGEYDLLEHMIESDILKKCNNIQIQFHDFFPEAQQLREKIREKLGKTHKETYNYYFVWENWELQ